MHAHFLDDLAVERAAGRSPTPAVFLSGNGPLVEVLQYELRSAGGGGKTFVRGVKDYVKQYSRNRRNIPPEHVLVFDEAQRAWDAERVAEKHPGMPAVSEPEHFIEFAERIPDWCVVVGLIGSGQEIYVGEEGGLVQWRRAIERSPDPTRWTVHGPPAALAAFRDSSLHVAEDADLNLDTCIRFHMAEDLDQFVEGLLALRDPAQNRGIADQLERQGYHLRLSRSLDRAKEHVRERYREHPTARFGIVRSSRDKCLADWGIAPESGGRWKPPLGPWFGEGDGHPESCRNLERAITEFDAQGLELDAVLLAWGTDLLIAEDGWSIELAKRFKNPRRIKSPMQLRLNTYRVLLTRGRDGTTVFVPATSALESTANYLVRSGFLSLD